MRLVWDCGTTEMVTVKNNGFKIANVDTIQLGHYETNKCGMPQDEKTHNKTEILQAMGGTKQ